MLKSIEKDFQIEQNIDIFLLRKFIIEKGETEFPKIIQKYKAVEDKIKNIINDDD